MKSRKKVSLCMTIGIFTLLLCFCGVAVAGPGPNSGATFQAYKSQGPSPVAFLMAGWFWTYDDANTHQPHGTLEAYVWVDGKLYIRILDTEAPESNIKATTVEDLIAKEEEDGAVTGWFFPEEIAEAYNFPSESTLVVVLSEKDVSEYSENLVIIGQDDPLPNRTYKHVLRTELKLSFLVPKSK